MQAVVLKLGGNEAAEPSDTWVFVVLPSSRVTLEPAKAGAPLHEASVRSPSALSSHRPVLPLPAISPAWMLFRCDHSAHGQWLGEVVSPSLNRLYAISFYRCKRRNFVNSKYRGG